MGLDIKTVTVIGGNGTVGKGVTGIFASFGNAKVYVVARSIDKAENGIESAIASVKAISIKNNLIPKTFDNLAECVLESDFVFESVSENIEIKTNVHKLINKYAKNNCIIATGTSGLSINELAICYDEEIRNNFLGIHFFNPPYNLTLCEIIPSQYNSDNKLYIENIKGYLEDVLLRKVVIVKDNPGFLANCIGFKFINDAIICASQYKEKGGIDYIDAILGAYTGRSMAPIETANFVGLDVHKAIVDNIYNNSKVKDDSFKLPKFVNMLVENKKLGLKVNEGFYKKTSDGIFVYDIMTGDYRKKKNYSFDFKTKAIIEFKNGNYLEGFNYIKNDNSEEAKLCMKFLLNYIIYSIELSKNIAEKINDCDVAMAEGFNWIPPISLIDVLGGKNDVIKLCKLYLNDSKNYEVIFENINSSDYDYGKYIKAVE